MVFRDDATKQGLIQECERLCFGSANGSISGNSTLLEDFTARLNNAKDDFYALVFQYDSFWNYDDTRQTDLPIATTGLVSGQTDYEFADELLGVTQVFVKDSSGVWHELLPQDDETAPRTFDLLDGSGLPTHYKLIGNSIAITPVSNYTQASSLKVVFKRNGPKFSSSDQGVEVGIPSLFHPFLARTASLSYLIDKGRSSKNDIAALIAKDEGRIATFMANRARPKRFGIRVTKEDNR